MKVRDDWRRMIAVGESPDESVAAVASDGGRAGIPKPMPGATAAIVVGARARFKFGLVLVLVLVLRATTNGEKYSMSFCSRSSSSVK